MHRLGSFVSMLKPAELKAKAKAAESPRDHLRAKAKCGKAEDMQVEEIVEEIEEVKCDDKDGPGDSKVVEPADDEEESFELEEPQEDTAKEADDGVKELPTPEVDEVMPGDAKGDGDRPDEDDDETPVEHPHLEGEEEEQADDDQEEEDEEDDDDDQAGKGLKDIHQRELADDEEDRQKLKEYVNQQSKQEVDQGWRNQGKSWKYRNKGHKGKGSHKGYKKGNHKGWNRGWNDWRWTQRGGHSKWGKWQDWDWDNQPQSSHGDLLIPDRKGQGYYLPGQQGFLDNNGVLHPPGEGLKGKTRVRGGVKAQISKRKAALEAEEIEAKKHNRQMMDKLASLAEKALDKM
eukprot:s4058_g9.t1